MRHLQGFFSRPINKFWVLTIRTNWTNKFWAVSNSNEVYDVLRVICWVFYHSCSYSLILFVLCGGRKEKLLHDLEVFEIFLVVWLWLQSNSRILLLFLEYLEWVVVIFFFCVVLVHWCVPSWCIASMVVWCWFEVLKVFGLVDVAKICFSFLFPRNENTTRGWL